MIKVEVTKKDISVTGHAMYDDYGKDIVCAAASSVITTSVESIASIKEDAIDAMEGCPVGAIEEVEDIAA